MALLSRVLKKFSGEYGEAIGRIRIPAGIEAECRSYHVHPAVLDTCLQLLGVAFSENRHSKMAGPFICPWAWSATRVIRRRCRMVGSMVRYGQENGRAG